jgi:phosphoglycolate phosphatase-like HAD superfamily hydrolase
VFKNILWDVDGTLLDTYPAITYAISKSLNEMGLSVPLNVIDGHARQSISDCVKTLSQRFKLDPDLLRDKFTESYRAISPANQTPFPGVREICEFIHQSGGLNIAITHYGIESARTLLNAHNLSALIDDIFSAKQGYPAKLESSMLLAKLEMHNLNPRETLLISNRNLDLQAGRAAGIRTCLFGQAELTTPADLQISEYRYLLNVLNKT